MTADTSRDRTSTRPTTRKPSNAPTAISPEAEALAAELEEIKSAKQRRETLVPRKTFASTIETDEETEELESQAFDDVRPSSTPRSTTTSRRDWILG
ncbi:MAG: hypothetical protein R2710_15305 [Acidimicrobiales bacterium]